jgi:hypothetical protein
MFSFPRPTVTNYHKFDSLKQKIFSRNSEDQKFEIKVLAWLVPSDYEGESIPWFFLASNSCWQVLAFFSL